MLRAVGTLGPVGTVRGIGTLGTVRAEGTLRTGSDVITEESTVWVCFLNEGS